MYTVHAMANGELHHDHRMVSQQVEWSGYVDSSFLLGAHKTSLSRNLIPVQHSLNILAKAADPEKSLKS